MGSMNVVSIPCSRVGAGLLLGAVPAVVQNLIRALPPAFLDALRAVLMEGASLGSKATRMP